MRKFLWLLLAAGLCAQERREAPEEIRKRMRELSQALEAGDWAKAAEESRGLKAAVTAHRDEQLSGASKDRIGEVLRWLPADTETVVVAQQPFALIDPEPNLEPRALAMAQGYLLNLLGAPEEGRLAKELEGRTVRFAVLAGRNFAVHPNDGSRMMPLGMVAWEGCAVYGFGEALRVGFQKRAPDFLMVGQEVWRFAGKDFMQAKDATPRSQVYLATLTRRDEMLLCNHEGFFQKVLERLSAVGGRPEFERLAEWTQVDRAAPVWGLRHFGPVGTRMDPTDLRVGGMVGAADRQATGVVFQVGPAEGQVRGRVLTRSVEDPLRRRAEGGGSADGRSGKRVGDGAWEYTTGDAGGQGYLEVFQWMALLGFMVVI